MRFTHAAPVVMALTMACSPAPTSTSMVACLTPATQGSPGQASLAALVDRADIVVHATITRTGLTNTPGNCDDQGVRRVTLRTIEVAKGFDLGSRYLAAVYDSREELLTIAADGFAVRPGPRSAALIAELR